MAAKKGSVEELVLAAVEKHAEVSRLGASFVPSRLARAPEGVLGPFQ